MLNVDLTIVPEWTVCSDMDVVFLAEREEVILRKERVSFDLVDDLSLTRSAPQQFYKESLELPARHQLHQRCLGCVGW